MPSPDPFLPYGRQTISEDDIAAVVQVLRSPCLTQGPAVPAFEQAVASTVGLGKGLQSIVQPVPCSFLPGLTDRNR